MRLNYPLIQEKSVIEQARGLMKTMFFKQWELKLYGGMHRYGSSLENFPCIMIIFLSLIFRSL